MDSAVMRRSRSWKHKMDDVTKKNYKSALEQNVLIILLRTESCCLTFIP